MIYFTSDLHFGHSNIIKIKNRPFQTIEEMNETLIKNINQTCTNHDTLVILGDIAYHQSIQTTENHLSQMKPKLVLIRGNHDREYAPGLFECICDYKKVLIYNHRIILCHYPILEWDGYFREAIHLHGHQHNGPEYNERMKRDGLRRYDVGVDANNYKPVSIKEIFNFFNIRIDDYGNSMKKITWK